jgi:hypothetical protein
VYRYDLVIRLIEQLGLVLRRLRDRILHQQTSEADTRAEIQAIAREAGLDLAFARKLDVGMLVAWLAPTENVDELKLWLMGELFYVEGLAGREAGERQSADSDLRRALAVFSRLAAGYRPASEAASAGERVEELAALLAAQGTGDDD